MPRPKAILFPGKTIFVNWPRATADCITKSLEFESLDGDLVTKCSNASKVLDPFEATSHSLHEAEPFHAVNFEFEGTDATLLRLEAEFAKSPSSSLLEVSQRRWVKPQGEQKTGDKRPPLQIGIIDFEK